MDDAQLDWNAFFEGHPILKDAFKNAAAVGLEGRKQLMCIRQSDVVLAVGTELRIASLSAIRTRPDDRIYKTLRTPSIDFPIHQLVLSPNGKLLAAIGLCQVAVVVLPKPGYSKLVSSNIECQAIQIGQYYHGTTESAPVSKVLWHPWGTGGMVLLVLTEDGKLREYDISVDSDEPSQTLSFLNHQRTRGFAVDDDEKAVSFALGEGKADWGPLTVHCLTSSGDVYSYCPYLPQNTSLPSSYVHALECYVSAKQDFASSSSASQFSPLYEQQLKYVHALRKQLPENSLYPSPSRIVRIRPPTTFKHAPKRQGPVLFQPSPSELSNSESSTATDILYVGVCGEYDEFDEGETEHVGVVLVAFSDGRVDVCLDVAKIEARWQTSGSGNDELPVLAVYECIDLGLVQRSSERNCQNLLAKNILSILPDPIHSTAAVIYDSFGVYTLDWGPWLNSITSALRHSSQDSREIVHAVQQRATTTITHLLNTLSARESTCTPILSLAITNDLDLSYGFFAYAANGRLLSIPLSPRDAAAEGSSSSFSSAPPATNTPAGRSRVPSSSFAFSSAASEDAAASRVAPEDGYVSMLTYEPFTLPKPLSSSGTHWTPSAIARFSASNQPNVEITPEVLRLMEDTAEELRSRVLEIRLALNQLQSRVAIQVKEYGRQRAKAADISKRVDDLSNAKHPQFVERRTAIQNSQALLLRKYDKLLQRVMDGVSPTPSQQEHAWYKELKRMKKEVLGAGKYDEASLKARTREVERQLERVKPMLQASAENTTSGPQQNAASNMGASQVHHFEKRLQDEQDMLLKAKRKLERLAKELGHEISAEDFPLENQVHNP